MARPRLLDLFCSAGGCARGYHDAIHASPPCQAYSITKHTHDKQHPDLLEPTRDRLKAADVPYVIENVPGAPMPGAILLCGAAFGLNAHDPATGLTLWLKRHRLFESNVPLWGPGGCFCKGKEIGGVYGGGSRSRDHARNVRRGGYTPAFDVQKGLMGIDWMTQAALAQAIPPAYTEFIGRQLLDRLHGRTTNGCSVQLGYPETGVWAAPAGTGRPTGQPRIGRDRRD